MNQSMTIPEQVAAIQREAAGDDLMPSRAAELLTKLAAALLPSCNADIRNADMKYNLVYKTCLETVDKANRAKIVAECSPEFEKKREARDRKEEVEALIASLKYYLRSYENEMRLAR